MLNYLLLVNYLFTFLSFYSAPSIFMQECTSIPEYDTTINLTKTSCSYKSVTLRAVIVICDNYISPDNNGIAQSVRVDMGTMTQMLNILEKRNIIKVEKNIIQGKKATRENVLNTLKSIKPEKDDIVMFYFSGHGGMAKGKTYIMTSDEQEIKRGEIELIIKSTNARLKIIITDACSNDADGMPATRSLSKTNQLLDSGAFDSIYKDLFLGYEGLMHISSSSEGEYAWSDDKIGGYFTYHFFKEGIIKKPVNDWMLIFNTAKDKTSQLFSRLTTSDERKILAQEGIKNQTAKALSMPKLIATTTDKNVNNSTQNDPGKISDKIFPTGNILISNFTELNVNFYIDNNVGRGKWLASKTTNMNIKAGKSVKINQAAVLVGFKYNAKDYYYELENGKYFFGLDENQKLDLFYQDDTVNKDNYKDVSQIDLNQLLIGKWQWQNAETNEMVITTFHKKTFSDHYQLSGDKEKGKWLLRTEKTDGEIYNIASFVYTLEEGSEYILEYSILYDATYPDEVQLVYYTAYQNGQEIQYEQNDDDYNAVIVMNKIR